MLLLGRSTAAAATGNGLLRALAGAGVGARALTAGREISAVAHAAVAADFNQTFNIHLHFAAQIAFNFYVLRNVIAQLGNFVFRQVLDANVGVHAGGR